MTRTDRRRLRQIRSYLRKIQLLLIFALALAAFTLGGLVRFASQYGEDRTAAQEITQEPAQTETRETAHQEEKPATEPLNAAVEPLVVEITPEPAEEPEPEPAPRYDITPAEFDLVARVVHREAEGEGFDGMALVAQCILTTAEATGQRPDAVVLVPGQYATPAAEASEEVKEAVKAVFIDGYQVTTEPVRYFYAPARCYSSWHENNLEFVLEHGGHRFFKARDAA